jgi:hypothetical protein
MRHQTGENREFSFSPAHLRAVTVFKVTARSFTGKRRAPPPGAPGQGGPGFPG